VVNNPITQSFGHPRLFPIKTLKSQKALSFKSP